MSSQTTPDTTQNEVKGGINIAIIFHLLRKSILLLIIFAILGGSGGAFYSMAQTRTFGASRSILMKVAVVAEKETGYATNNTTAGSYYMSTVKTFMKSQFTIAIANLIYTADKYMPGNEFSKEYDPANPNVVCFEKMAYDYYDNPVFDGTKYGITDQRIGTYGHIYSGNIGLTSSSENYNYFMTVNFNAAADDTLSDADNYKLVKEKLRCYIEASRIVVSLLRNPTETDPAKQKSKFFEADISFNTNLNPDSAVYSTNFMERNITFGVIIGLAGAVVIVVILYLLDDTLKSKDELEAITGVKVFALIEDMKPNVKKHKKHKSGSSKTKEAK